jgi:hypothetical protein
LSLQEKSLGLTHPAVATTLYNLAELIRTQRTRHVSPAPLYRRALSIWEQSLGPEHPDVAKGQDCLAEAYRREGKFDKAEMLLHSSLAIREKALAKHI